MSLFTLFLYHSPKSWGTILSKKEKLYTDLPNHRACDNPPATIPQDIVTTSAQPDSVVIYGNKVTLIELTVSYNSPEALSNARLRKRNKENYQLVLSELDRKGFKASLITLEIGARLFSTSDSFRPKGWSPLPHQEEDLASV